MARSLARRIMLAGAALSIATGIGLGGASAVSDFRRGIDNATRNLDRLLYSAQPQLAHAYWQVDAEAVRSILDRLAEEPLIRSLAIVDLTLPPEELRQAGLGDLRAAAQRGDRAPPFAGLLPRDWFSAERALMLSNPRDGRPMARLDVALSYGALYEAFGHQAARIVTLGVLQALVIASMLYLLVRRRIIRPLSALGARVRARQAGRAPAPLPPRADEIGHLAADVDSAFDEVERYRDRLQEEVDLRTRELVVARRRAEAASRAKSAFLANMSHELRTPLNAITGLSDLLLTSGLPGVACAQVADIRAAARLLLGGIDEVLDLSKLEAGRMEVRHAPFALRELVEEVAAQTRALIAGRGLRFESRVAPGLPDGLGGDRQKVAQVLLNLTSNAAKFTRHGGVRLRVFRHGGRLIFTVADSGPGIASADMAAIFEPFMQVDDSTARRAGGTGLGLAIARQMAEAMGGTLRARSLPGRGSVFRLELPLVAAAAPAPEAAVPEAVLRGRAVLVVEDRALNRSVVESLLAQAGARVTGVAGGREAVALLSAPEQEPPDVVLMDLHMPEFDGFAALRALRARGGPAVPVIASSADVSVETRAACAEAGFDGFLPKPITFAALARALDTAMEAAFPVLDRAALARMAGADAVGAAWLAMLPGEIRAWRALLAEAQGPEARAAACHAIRGGAAQTGARDLARIAEIAGLAPGRVEAALDRLERALPLLPAPPPEGAGSPEDCRAALARHEMRGIDLALMLAPGLPGATGARLRDAAERLDFDAAAAIVAAYSGSSSET